jgi:16S rRNA (uracil1498-N3)-methyltransferase
VKGSPLHARRGEPLTLLGMPHDRGVTLRLYVETPLVEGILLDLPPGPARHVQVRRAQPGDALVLFDGRGGEWHAEVTRMGRQQVTVFVSAHDPVEREAAIELTLAVGMPANERMDWLVEKATELGAAAIRPLVCERSVLRLDGDRAERKRAHWQAIAVAAAEQCGRTRVPEVARPEPLALALDERRAGFVLSLAPEAAPLRDLAPPSGPLWLLSGPEGGLSPAEEAQARAAGLAPLSLGARVLRAETAPLVPLSRWTA